MLDLTFNPLSKFYEAPLQLKANGGVFLVDDFGRQRMRPEDLLNRWIVPLESRVDYLTLHTGKKFQVPFDVLIVFATNLDPASLADEAFLRRIPYKIPIDDPIDRGVHAHLRAELPPPRPAVPPGDGRLPAAAPLPARRPAAARLPSARPARPGHRALPLPRHRARASRARCSTPRARPISSSQAPEIGGPGRERAPSPPDSRPASAGPRSEPTSPSYDPRARAHWRRGRVIGRHGAHAGGPSARVAGPRVRWRLMPRCSSLPASPFTPWGWVSQSTSRSWTRAGRIVRLVSQPAAMADRGGARRMRRLRIRRGPAEGVRRQRRRSPLLSGRHADTPAVRLGGAGGRGRRRGGPCLRNRTLVRGCQDHPDRRRVHRRRRAVAQGTPGALDRRAHRRRRNSGVYATQRALV